MKDLQKAAPHLLMSFAVIVAFVVMALDHIITGGEAYGGVLAAGGFTLGGTVASSSISTAAAATVDVSHSASPQATTHSTTPATQSPEATSTQTVTKLPPVDSL